MKHLFLQICALLFMASGVHAVPGDLLAADRASAAYRTTKAHPVIHRVPAHLQKMVFRQPKRYLPQLVAFLIRGSKNGYETSKRLHDWVSYNIAYDSDLFMGLGRGSGSRGIYGALRLKRTTCSGFARIMQKMAQLAGLRAEYVSAHSRSYKKMSTGKTAGHAWVAVWIGGKPYFVDCSADSRSSFKYGKFSPKRKYKYHNLFLHPKAKIHSNLPLRRELTLLDNPPTYREWMGWLRTTSHYYGFKIRFLSDMKKLVRVISDPREGGKLLSLYDQITMRGSPLEIRFTSKRKKNNYRAILIDKNNKYQRTHVWHYSEGDEEVCVVSPPSPGLYTLYLKAGKMEEYKAAHTFYKCRILATRAGQPPPLVTGKLYQKRRMRYYGIKVNSTHLQGGVCGIDLSWPEGQTVYTTVIDAAGKRAWKKRSISYLKKNRKRWYFSTKGRGPFYLQIRARRTGRHKYHRLVAFARIKRVSGDPEPLNELVYWKRWLKKGLRIVSENASEKGKRVYEVKVKAPAGLKMICNIRSSDQQRHRKHALSSYQNGLYTFRFTAPGKGRYQARLYASNGKGRYNTVLSFAFQSTRRGQELPLAGRLHRLPAFAEKGIKILQTDLDGESGYRYLRIRSRSGDRISFGLYDDNGKRQRGYYFHQQKGQTHHLYFTEPGRGRFTARVYAIRKKKYSRVLQFSFNGKGVGKKLPLEGQIYLYRRFRKNGLQLVSPFWVRRNDGGYTIRVRSRQGVEMTCRLLNKQNRLVRDSARTEVHGDEYTFTFRPPAPGRYLAKFYLLKSNGKRQTVGRVWLLHP